MDKFRKSQILKLLVIVAFLIITPLLSTSLRPTYLYFILNLLIIVLGAEAGILSSTSNPGEAKKHAIAPVSVAEKPAIGFTTFEASNPNDKQEENQEAISHVKNKMVDLDHAKPKAKVVQKSSSEKIKFVGSFKHKVKKCPSTPSLFFIGGDEIEDHNDDDQKGVGEISGQELYHKAETFIGNFYKQLKMQREDSWKKLHDLYHKAF